MGALAPLNLLVILNAHIPEVLAELRPLQEDDVKTKFEGLAAELEGLAADAEVNLDDDKLGSSEKLVRALATPKHPGADEDTGDPDSRRCLGELCRVNRRPGYDSTGAAIMGAIGVATLGSAASSDSSTRAEDDEHGGDDVNTSCTSDASVNRSSWLPHQLSDGVYVDDSAARDTQSSIIDPQYLEGHLQVGGSKPSSSASNPTIAGSCLCKCPCSEKGLPVLSQNLSEDQREAKVTLVMSPANIATLVFLTFLSVFGAVYVWKILTRKQCRCRICHNQYRKMEQLGSGGYGSVYRVDRMSDGEEFVAKWIQVRDITEVDQYSLEAKELITLRHKHIVSYEDDFVHVEHGALEPKTYFIIVMEYCPEGDLKLKIEHDFSSFTEDYIRTVFAQLLDAVQYLHSKNVIHRDLKSQNVFLAQDGHVRLGDFGLCKHTRTQADGSLSHAGTDCYMAPEMLSTSKYGKPADVWALGCVLFEMVTGVFMWELDGILGAMVMKDAHTVDKLLKANLMPPVGKALVALLKRLLSVRATARPTVTDCIRKKMFKRGHSLSKVPFGDFINDGEGEDPSESPTTFNTKSSNASGDESTQSFHMGSSNDDEVQNTPPKRKRRPRKKRAARPYVR